MQPDGFKWRGYRLKIAERIQCVARRVNCLLVAILYNWLEVLLQDKNKNIL